MWHRALPPCSRAAPTLRRTRILGLLLLVGCATLQPAAPFRVRFIDQHTGRGVPAVEMRTNDGRSFVSDSAGMVALLEPDLFGLSVFFRVRSFGYRFGEELFGVPGTILRIRRGGSTTLPLFRENVAERYYRITGTGIYRDSELLGDAPPSSALSKDPPPFGMDSALATVYGGRLFWIWGDTRVPSNPLGNFRATGATSELPGRGGLEPDRGIELRFFRDGGSIRPMVDSDHGVVWLDALRVGRDAAGRERLFATYRNIGSPMVTLEAGLVEFDDTQGRFRIAATYGEDAPILPSGHVFPVTDDGRTYLHYDLAVRSPADAESIRSIDRYEAFTPLRRGARASLGAAALERDARGRLVWGWKRDTPPMTRELWDRLVAAGHVTPREAWYRLMDTESGQAITPHHGSVRWNPHRRRWVMIRSEIGGASFLGEVYYAEADTPLGPWAYARKILTHARTVPGKAPQSAEEQETQTFYNPVHHPEFDRNRGRQIFFEGTLSATFSDSNPIPGYDYNQIMYSLDLEDPRLYVPVAIYRGRTPAGGWSYRTYHDREEASAPRELAFFAPDRPRAGTVAMREEIGPGALPRLTADPQTRQPAGSTGSRDTRGPIRFYCAVAPDVPATVALYEVRDATGWIYTTQPVPGARPVCRVWPAPVDFPAQVTRPSPTGIEAAYADSGLDSGSGAGMDSSERRASISTTTSSSSQASP